MDSVDLVMELDYSQMNAKSLLTDFLSSGYFLFIVSRDYMYLCMCHTS